MSCQAPLPTEAPPEALQRARYWYDGDGNMVKSVVNETVTYSIGKLYQKEVDGSAVTVRKHYLVGGQQVAVRTVAGQSDVLRWVLTDHLGSASVTANADGSWNSELRYAAFGETHYSSGITLTEYRYTGQLRQAEVGLYDYGARWYDALARFIQADALIPSPGNFMAWDRYAYVMNSPVRYSDPSGHCVIEGAGFGTGEFTKEMFERRYNNVTLKGDNWTSDRIKTVYQAHAISSHLHGGLEGFQADVGKYDIRHNERIKGAMVWPNGRHMIISDTFLDSGWTHKVVHEIGHVFDFKNSYSEVHINGSNTRVSSITRPSDTFISTFSSDSGCSSSAVLGCVTPHEVNENFQSSVDIYSTVNQYMMGSPNKNYSPSGQPTAYGAIGSLDDFAESYAYAAYMDVGLAYPESKQSVDVTRMMIIHTWVDIVH